MKYITAQPGKRLADASLFFIGKQNAPCSRWNYASDLIASGIARNNIYEIAFAFDGKEVLVKERHVTASDDGV